jgi:hypothetical protein
MNDPEVPFEVPLDPFQDDVQPLPTPIPFQDDAQPLPPLLPPSGGSEGEGFLGGMAADVAGEGLGAVLDGTVGEVVGGAVEVTGHAIGAAGEAVVGGLGEAIGSVAGEMLGGCASGCSLVLLIVLLLGFSGAAVAACHW